jgi:hypothetical protein
MHTLMCDNALKNATISSFYIITKSSYNRPTYPGNVIKSIQVKIVVK